MKGEPEPQARPDELILVCRACTRLGEQIAQGGGSRCLQPCGGPTKNMAYPLYRGPLTENALGSLCFVCGAAPEGQLVIRGPDLPGGVRRLGVCPLHWPYTGRRKP